MSPFEIKTEGKWRGNYSHISLIYIVYYNGCFVKKIESKCMKVYNSTQNNLIADDVKIAKNFITRSLGLIPKKIITEKEGLIIKPCCSIHTFFMKFPIDILFVDRKNRIIALYENVGKNHILPIHWNSLYVIELCAGQISAKNIKKGDIIISNE